MHSLLLLVDTAVDTDRVLLSGNITWIVGLALTGLMSVATWATSMLAKKLSAQSEASIKSMLLRQLAEFTDAVVHKVGATLKTQYALAAVDGKISGSEAKMLADAALKDIKQLLGEEGLARLKTTFGWGQAEVDTQIRGVLEKKVAEAKLLTAATSSPLRRPLTIPNP